MGVVVEPLSEEETTIDEEVLLNKFFSQSEGCDSISPDMVETGSPEVYNCVSNISSSII